MGRRRPLALLVVVGALVAVGVPTVWFATRPAKAVGADVAEALADATPAPTRSSRPAPRRSTAAAPTVPAVPTRDGRLGAGSRSAARVDPVEIGIPALGVSSRVLPIGVEDDGELEIPEDVQTVGWYRFGPRPGDRAGSVVMSGHIDSAEQGRGAFFRLPHLGPGDPVSIRLSDGRTWRYRVVSREEWPKSVVPLDRIFSRDGAARLTLVTCGGGFRKEAGSYQDNIAVTAVPVDTP